MPDVHPAGEAVRDGVDRHGQGVVQHQRRRHPQLQAALRSRPLCHVAHVLKVEGMLAQSHTLKMYWRDPPVCWHRDAYA